MILDLLYPQRCPFCKEIRPYQETVACSKCVEKLKKVEPPHCMRCGKTVENPEEEYCGDCVAISKHFVRGFPVFSYEEPVKSALYDFKYKNQRNYAGFFADCIYQYYGEQLKKIKLEGLVPVPVHRHKKRSRGYNQAELLAVELGKRMGLPVFGDYLLREVDTNPQKELGDKARMKNIKNAFKISPNAIKLKKILLVDDIYTSGATVDACTCALQDFGVDEVYYTSVAIGKGY